MINTLYLFIPIFLMYSCVQSEIDVDTYYDESLESNRSSDSSSKQPLKLSINSNYNYLENHTSGEVKIPVSLNRATSNEVSVTYNISSITTEGGDHSYTSGVIVFHVGEKDKTISVPIINDTIDEDNEDFKVSLVLASSSEITLENDESIITIIDDDPEPIVSISDYTAQPGETAKLSISLDRESERNLSFELNSVASGSAMAGTDFLPVSSEIINFPNNSTNLIFQNKTYYVDINEPAKDYSLTLSDPNLVTLGDTTGDIDIIVPGGGVFDKAFSDDGKEISFTGGPYDRAKAVLPLPNGHVYTLNHSQANGSVHRYTDEGVLDNSFSGNGILTVNIFSGYDSIVDGVAFVDMSLIAISSSRSVEDSFDIFKILPNGNFDSTFSGDGKREIGLGGYTGGKAIAMEIDNQGRILVGGYIYNTDKEIYITRLNLDGSTDTSFGTSGVVILDILGTNTDDYLHDIQANADGTFYIGGVNLTGNLGPSFVARFLENGSLDTSFNSDGVYESLLNVDYSNRSIKMSINALGDKSIVLTTPNREASRTYSCQIEKILSNGNIDTAFGVSGYFTATPGPNIHGCRKTLEDSNGNLVVYSGVLSGGYPDAVFVLSPLGIQDMSFNGGTGYRAGMTGTAQGVQFDRGFSMSSDGKLLFAGGFNDIAVSKVWYSDNNIPNITISDNSFNEGEARAYLTYELSHRVEFPFQISATTADGTGIAGSDYSALNSFIIENLGRIGGRIAVSLVDDGIAEVDETLNLNISTSNPHVNITGPSAELTILNDD